MMGTRILSYGTFAAVVALLLTLYVTAVQSTTKADGMACYSLSPVQLNTPAPDFTLKDLTGKEVTLSQYGAGKTTLLHFWATWCAPCLEELPSLFRLQASMKDPNFRLLTVSMDDSSKIVQDFFAKQGWPALPVLVDPSKKIPTSFGTTKLPETYIIDKNGVVRFRFVNKRNWGTPMAQACIKSVIDRT